MEIVKPFGVAQLVRDQVVTNDKMIHFILPVSSAVSERFQDFLKSFEDICLQTLGNYPFLMCFSLLILKKPQYVVQYQAFFSINPPNGHILQTFIFVEHVYLMIILFMGRTDHERDKSEEMRVAALDLSRRYRKAHIRVIQTNKEFSRAMGYEIINVIFACLPPI